MAPPLILNVTSVQRCNVASFLRWVSALVSAAWTPLLRGCCSLDFEHRLQDLGAAWLAELISGRASAYCRWHFSMQRGTAVFMSRSSELVSFATLAASCTRLWAHCTRPTQC